MHMLGVSSLRGRRSCFCASYSFAEQNIEASRSLPRVRVPIGFGVNITITIIIIIILMWGISIPSRLKEAYWGPRMSSSSMLHVVRRVLQALSVFSHLTRKGYI